MNEDDFEYMVEIKKWIKKCKNPRFLVPPSNIRLLNINKKFTTLTENHSGGDNYIPPPPKIFRAHTQNIAGVYLKRYAFITCTVSYFYYRG